LHGAFVWARRAQHGGFRPPPGSRPMVHRLRPSPPRAGRRAPAGVPGSGPRAQGLDPIDLLALLVLWDFATGVPQTQGSGLKAWVPRPGRLAPGHRGAEVSTPRSPHPFGRPRSARRVATAGSARHRGITAYGRSS
jgi:hypothetical protein